MSETSDWMKIETAPQDGRSILAARFDDEEGDWHAVVNWDGEEWIIGDADLDFHVRPAFEPTHWQPLPNRLRK